MPDLLIARSVSNPPTHTHTFCVRLTHREVLVVLKEKDAQFKMHRCVTRIEIRKVYKMCIMLASADLGGGVGIFFIGSTHVRVSVMSRYSELTVHLSSIILYELLILASLQYCCLLINIAIFKTNIKSFMT